MELRMLFLTLALVPTMSFAAGKSSIECESPVKGNNPIKIDVTEIKDCDFVLAGTDCDFHFGNDQFWSVNFNRDELAKAQAGESIAGTYLEGYLWKKYEISSSETVSCLVR